MSSSSKPKKVTQKGLAEQAKENDVNFSKDAKQYLADPSNNLTMDDASEILDYAINITKTLNHKTIKKDYVEIVMSILDASKTHEDSGKKMSKKRAGEIAHTLDCNMGEEARTQLSSVEKNKADHIIRSACQLAKSEKKKTINAKYLNILMDVWKD